tara:strand:+ start:10168 stop:11241 length:1074 start_codon:yes stop_codon:yes gene_type:complete
MSKHGMAVGLNHSEMSYHILADDVSGENPIIACPVQINGAGGRGLYTLIGNMGSPTGAVIVKFNPLSVPDRCAWTYDGTTASEYSSASEGYLEGVVGTISAGSNCGLTNANGSNGATFTGNNHYYDTEAEAFESDGTTVDLNGGNAYTASQVTLTNSAPGDCTMVIPKPSLSPTNVTLVIDGPCPGTGWRVDMYCAKNLNGKAMGGEGKACSTINLLTGAAITGGTTLNAGSDISGSINEFVFGPGIPLYTRISAVNVGGNPNVATLSNPATNAVGIDISISPGAFWYVDVSHAEGNTFNSTGYNQDTTVEVNDWAFQDFNAVGQLAAGTYPVEITPGVVKQVTVSSDGIVTSIANC